MEEHSMNIALKYMLIWESYVNPLNHMLIQLSVPPLIIGLQLLVPLLIDNYDNPTESSNYSLDNYIGILQ